MLKRVLADDQTTLVALYTEEAVKFIREHKDEPFFLYLPHSAVHFPIYPGEAFQGKSNNGIYGDWVEEVDWSVGQVLDTVRELGLSENTLVIFTSDNGGTQRGVNAPLRGYKGSTWEGGMREPTIAWWPGKIPAGTETDAVTSMMDILPTFVKLAGGSLPADRKLDGGDIWPILAGEPGAKSPHDVFYYYRGLNLQAVRSGPWKLHLAKTELYNLETDIGETTNVAAANPDEVAAAAGLGRPDEGRSRPGRHRPRLPPAGQSAERPADHQPRRARSGRILENHSARNPVDPNDADASYWRIVPMRDRITVALFWLVCLLLQPLEPAHTADHPNVILMMADDMGWGDTGYNGNRIIKTPNLDRMSRRGDSL